MAEKEDRDLFLKVPNEILKLTHIPSRVEVDVNGKPIMVEFGASDKLIYLTMKKRFDYFGATQKPNSVGSTYYDTHIEIAIMCGVSKKTVTRFVKKWKDHGYIDYVNYASNRANYTMFEPIPLDGTPTVLVSKGIIEIPNEQEYFAERVYIDPEDDTEWRSYDLNAVGAVEKSNKASSFDDFNDCPFE